MLELHLEDDVASLQGYMRGSLANCSYLLVRETQSGESLSLFSLSFSHTEETPHLIQVTKLGQSTKSETKVRQGKGDKSSTAYFKGKELGFPPCQTRLPDKFLVSHRLP